MMLLSPSMGFDGYYVICNCNLYVTAIFIVYDFIEATGEQHIE